MTPNLRTAPGQRTADLVARRRSGREWVVKAGLASALALVSALTSPSLADDVHLTNGAVFEDVSTEVTETHVVIEMPIGRLKLPASQVARIIVGESPISEYRRRSNSLLANPSSGGTDFLELARWSVRHGLTTQARQAALLAARFSPDLKGLNELLQGLGYEHVHGIGWLPYADAQRSRGLVLLDGEWLTPQEREQRITQELAEARRPQRTATSRGETADGDRELARESMELARRPVEVADDSSRRADERRHPVRAGFAVHGPRFGALQNNVYGGVVLPVGGVDPEAAAAYRDRVARDLKALATRAPGSLIPVQQHRPPN